MAFVLAGALGKDKGEIALLFQVQVQIIAFYLILLLLATGIQAEGGTERKVEFFKLKKIYIQIHSPRKANNYFLPI